MANEGLVDHLLHAGELFVARNLRVDAMKLPEIDVVDAQESRCSSHTRAETWGCVRVPDVGTGALEAAFGGDEETIIGIERLAQKAFAQKGP